MIIDFGAYVVDVDTQQTKAIYQEQSMYEHNRAFERTMSKDFALCEQLEQWGIDPTKPQSVFSYPGPLGECFRGYYAVVGQMIKGQSPYQNISNDPKLEEWVFVGDLVAWGTFQFYLDQDPDVDGEGTFQIQFSICDA